MVAYTYYSRDPRVKREAGALLDMGYQVDLIALREDFKKGGHKNGIRLISVPLTRWRGGALGYMLNYFLFLFYSTSFITYYYLTEKYDLIFVHNMPDFLVFCGLVPKLLGSKVILDVHDPMPELYSTIFGLGLESVISKLIILQSQLSYQFSDKILTVHEGMRDLLLRRGVKYKKVEVIHNLPDPSIFGKSNAKPLNGRGFTLIYAGTVSRRHGLDIVIKAIELLGDEIPGIRFMIVGEGPDILRLRGLAKNQDLEKKITFEGVVPLEEIPTYLAKSDVCVAPYSKDPYGDLVFPTKVLESFMVGIPVICSRTPTVMKYLDETMLFLFDTEDPLDLANQIKIIASDRNLVNQKLGCAENFLEKMNWEIEKKKLVRIVEEICGRFT